MDKGKRGVPRPHTRVHMEGRERKEGKWKRVKRMKTRGKKVGENDNVAITALFPSSSPVIWSIDREFVTSAKKIREF